MYLKSVLVTFGLRGKKRENVKRKDKSFINCHSLKETQNTALIETSSHCNLKSI